MSNATDLISDAILPQKTTIWHEKSQKHKYFNPLAPDTCIRMELGISVAFTWLTCQLHIYDNDQNLQDW